MNAGRILAGAGLDTDELRLILHPVDPYRVNVWPASRRLRRFWRPGVRALTQARWILVDPAMLTDPERLSRLVVHELVHVRQFAETGYLRFMIRYLTEYLRGRRSGLSQRDAYLAIPAEVEARGIASRVTLSDEPDDPHGRTG